MLASKQIAQTVNEAMDALPLDLRTAIVLREIEGLSYEEISAIMGCPIGTVRSRIFRAREVIAENCGLYWICRLTSAGKRLTLRISLV